MREELTIIPQELYGNWVKGWALDLHTISSIKLPNGKFKTKRTQVGEFLYLLKYCQIPKIEDLINADNLPDDLADAFCEYYHAVETLALVAAKFLKIVGVPSFISAIIPVPPSKPRFLCLVEDIAKEVGRLLRLHVAEDYLLKVKPTPELKSVDDPISRRQTLRGAFKVKDRRFAGKSVLVFDDIYRSGETLTEVTRVLYEEGKVGAVYVLTLTKTRVKR